MQRNLRAFAWIATAAVAAGCSSPSPHVGAFFGVHGRATDDVWAVGIALNDAGPMAHWDGHQWRALDVANLTSPPIFELDSVYCLQTSDCWAVGAYTPQGWTQSAGVAIHWNGSAWSLSMTNGSGPACTNATCGTSLSGVWASSASDVWAVGDAAIVSHFDGTAWSHARIAGAGTSLKSVWGSSATDVWAVGVAGCAASGWIFHWDGSTWTDRSPMGCGASSVQGSGSDDVYVASSPPQHWDGHAWTELGASGPVGANGVWVSGAGDAWFAGGVLSLADTCGGGEIDHWNGMWTTALEETSSDQVPSLIAIHGFGPNDIWAVGGCLGGEGTAWHFDGSHWSRTF